MPFPYFSFCLLFRSTRQHGSNGDGDIPTFKWDFDTIKIRTNTGVGTQNNNGSAAPPAVPAHGPSSPKKQVTPQIPAASRTATPPVA